MTKTEARIASTAAALAYALTGKSLTITNVEVWELIHGHEFYLPDGGYSRIVVSQLTGIARLTSNSRDQVKEAWGRCRELISDLEVRVKLRRKELDPTYETHLF